MLLVLLTTLTVSSAPQEISCAALRGSVSVLAAPGVKVQLQRVGENRLRLSSSRATRTVPLDCFSEQIRATVADFNFDGIRDVAVPVSVGYMGVNVFSRVYFVEPAGTLRASRLEIGNLWPDPLTRTLTSDVKDGPFYRTETHCLTPDSRDLYLCRQLLPVPDAASPGMSLAQWLGPAGQVLLSRRADVSRPKGSEFWRVTPARSYVHARPEAATRSAAYVIHGDEVEGLEVRGAWMRVVYRPAQGPATVGWLRQQDLR